MARGVPQVSLRYGRLRPAQGGHFPLSLSRFPTSDHHIHKPGMASEKCRYPRHTRPLAIILYVDDAMGAQGTSCSSRVGAGSLQPRSRQHRDIITASSSRYPENFPGVFPCSGQRVTAFSGVQGRDQWYVLRCVSRQCAWCSRATQQTRLATGRR